jgi:hypothetical protein
MDLQCINNNWSFPYVVFLSLVLSCVLIPLFFCNFMFCHFCPHIYWPTLWASLSNYLMVPKGIFPSIWFPSYGPFQCFLLLISFPIIECASTLSTYLSIVLLFFRPISFVLIHVIHPLLLLSRLVSFYFA